MNRKIIAVLMLVLTISFLLMGALYGKTAETQKGIEVSFGTMVDGEFVSNETEHLVEISESMKYCSQVESFFMVLVE